MMQARHFRGLLPSVFALSGVLLLGVLAGCGASTYSAGTAGAPPAATATTAPTTAAATATPAATTAPVTNPRVVIQSGGGLYSSFSFAPSTMTVKMGVPVIWTNSTGTPHTVTSDSGAPAAFDSGTVSANGGTFTFTFTTPGTYTYHCKIHPYMHGTIVVVAA